MKPILRHALTLCLPALGVLAAPLAAPLAAQTSPYAGEAPRTIKALSEEDIDGLLDGAGLGYARAAELNGVPGPRHVLDMAGQLELDDDQREVVQDIFLGMQREARRLGIAIVERERELDALFATGTATDADVRQRSIELGRLYGELRAVHLNAHLETVAVLTPEQITRYDELRGYSTGEGGGVDAGEGGDHGDGGHEGGGHEGGGHEHR